MEDALPRLQEALTHPSYANEQPRDPPPDNQRLEFLGDAVLDLCVSELLMDRFPMANEGKLSRWRAALVNTDALASWGRKVGIPAALRMGKGARAAGEGEQNSVIADTVEAVLAAVYLKAGIHGAKALSEKIVGDALVKLTTGETEAQDAKSRLQEIVQAAGMPPPMYRLVETEGPQHQPTFVVEVAVDGVVAGRGEGRSKKLAEQAAAEVALSAWKQGARSPC